jgi:hypothetical protein
MFQTPLGGSRSPCLTFSSRLLTFDDLMSWQHFAGFLVQ